MLKNLFVCQECVRMSRIDRLKTLRRPKKILKWTITLQSNFIICITKFFLFNIDSRNNVALGELKVV